MGDRDNGIGRLQDFLQEAAGARYRPVAHQIGSQIFPGIKTEKPHCNLREFRFASQNKAQIKGQVHPGAKTIDSSTRYLGTFYLDDITLTLHQSAYPQTRTKKKSLK